MTYSKMGIALVTGASAGIGAIYADRLARRGYDLILVARSQERLDEVAKRIAGSTGRNVSTVAADLNDKADLGRVETLARHRSRHHDVGQQCRHRRRRAAFGVRRRQNAGDDRAQRHGADPPDLCRGSGLCGARRRHDHQHLVGRRYRAGNSQRRLWRDESLCARFQPFAPQGACGQEAAHPGGSARRRRHQFLGRVRRVTRRSAEQGDHAVR